MQRPLFAGKGGPDVGRACCQSATLHRLNSLGGCSLLFGGAMRVARRLALMITVVSGLVLSQAQTPDTQAPSPAAPAATPQATTAKPAPHQVTAPTTATQMQAQPETPPPTPPTSANPTGAHPLTTSDLEAFFDGMVPLQLERSDVAGASVLVMKD